MEKNLLEVDNQKVFEQRIPVDHDPKYVREWPDRVCTSCILSAFDEGRWMQPFHRFSKYFPGNYGIDLVGGKSSHSVF